MCSLKIKKFVDKIMYLILIVCSLTTLFSCRDEIMDDLQHSIEQKSSNQDSIAQLRGLIDSPLGHIPNIEDYKDFKFDNNVEFFNRKLNQLKNIDFFPKVIDKTYTLISLSNEIKTYSKYYIHEYDFFNLHKQRDIFWLRANKNKYSSSTWKQMYVDMINNCFENMQEMKFFVEVYFKNNILLTPKEAYEQIDFLTRMKLRANLGKQYKINGLEYGIIPYSLYQNITGIGVEDEYGRLRVLTYSKQELQDWFKFGKLTSLIDEEENNQEKSLCRLSILQMPYKDNYKDLYNDYRFTNNLKLLKRFIKPGSIIYVKGQGKMGKWITHTMLVMPNWFKISDMQNSSYIKSDSTFYKEYQTYERQFTGRTYVYNKQLRKDMYDDNVLFSDYLKRFVFIESTPNISYKNYCMPGFDLIGIKLTSGNDEYLQNELLYYIKRYEKGQPFEEHEGDHWVEIGIANVHYGIELFGSTCFPSAELYACEQLGNSYGLGEAFIEQNNDYCSGLILRIYKYSQNNVLLLKDNETDLFLWYMPKTLVHSPYVYTRGFLLNKDKYPH